VAAAERADEAEEILRRHGGRDVRMRDPERVGYGVAGGSSSMEVREEDQADDADVMTATRVFPAMPEAPAAAPERPAATPISDLTPPP